MANTKTQVYFPHYANNRNETKLLELRMDLGVAGYGVYFMLLEQLRMQDDYTCVINWKTLCYDFDCDEELIRSVIFDYGLFNVYRRGEILSYESVDLNEYMALMEAKRKKRSEDAKRAADARWGNSASQSHEDPVLVTRQDLEPKTVTDEQSKPEEKTPAVLVAGPQNKAAENEEPVAVAGPAAYSDDIPVCKEINEMEKDAEWIMTVSDQCHRSTGEVQSLLTDFKRWCLVSGRREGHKNIIDAKSHFYLWMENNNYLKKRMLTKGEPGPRADKVNIKEEKYREQRDRRIAERQEEYKRMEQNRTSPDDYIRNQGYDPKQVTMVMICQPGWKENNPPTHPEWIGKYCKAARLEKTIEAPF